jgi:hypothetical protein
MKVVNLTTIVPKDVAMVFQNNLTLFFNFYIHSFDKFVEKIEHNVHIKNNLKLRCGFSRIKELYLNAMKILPVITQRQAIRKLMMLKIKKGVLLQDNHSNETSVQIYYVRCNYSFLMGFVMSKAQSRCIMKDLLKYIKKKLDWDVPKNVLRHISSDKIKFLGFEIYRIPVRTLKQFTDKKLEVYKRHRNKSYREGVRDYMQFLKAVE